MRFARSDDVWLMGQHYWFYGGYSSGTPVLGMCLNISTIGTVTANYELRTPLVYADKLQGNGASQVIIDGNVIITGNLTVNGSSNYKPFWEAGKVDGTTLNSLATNGRSGFTVTRVSGYSAGVYYIKFGSNPYNDAHYVINVSNQASVYCKLWESAIPTVNGFYIVWYTNATTPANAIIHFQLLRKLI